MADLITQAVPAKAPADALAAIRQARQALVPYLVALTPEERAALPKMGDKSVAFVTKAAEFAQRLPALMPQYLDVAGLVIDAGVSADLLPLYLELNSFATDVDSTAPKRVPRAIRPLSGGVQRSPNWGVIKQGA